MTDTAPKRSFAALLEQQGDTTPPIDLVVKGGKREFIQEQFNIPVEAQLRPIVYAQKERKITIEEQRPQDNYDKILIEIARLSREWDYLDLCELQSALHMAIIKNEKDKMTDLQIKILRHPLYNDACFLKNELEYNLLGKMMNTNNTRRVFS